MVMSEVVSTAGSEACLQGILGLAYPSQMSPQDNSCKHNCRSDMSRSAMNLEVPDSSQTLPARDKNVVETDKVEQDTYTESGKRRRKKRRKTKHATARSSGTINFTKLLYRRQTRLSSAPARLGTSHLSTSNTYHKDNSAISVRTTHLTDSTKPLDKSETTVSESKNVKNIHFSQWARNQMLLKYSSYKGGGGVGATTGCDQNGTGSGGGGDGANGGDDGKLGAGGIGGSDVGSGCGGGGSGGSGGGVSGGGRATRSASAAVHRPNREVAFTDQPTNASNCTRTGTIIRRPSSKNLYSASAFSPAQDFGMYSRGTVISSAQRQLSSRRKPQTSNSITPTTLLFSPSYNILNALRISSVSRSSYYRPSLSSTPGYDDPASDPTVPLVHYETDPSVKPILKTSDCMRNSKPSGKTVRFQLVANCRSSISTCQFVR